MSSKSPGSSWKSPSEVGNDGEAVALLGRAGQHGAVELDHCLTTGQHELTATAEHDTFGDDPLPAENGWVRWVRWLRAGDSSVRLDGDLAAPDPGDDDDVGRPFGTER